MALLGFTTIQKKFAQRLWLLSLLDDHDRAGNFDIDTLVGVIEGSFDGNEPFEELIVNHIPAEDRSLVNRLEAMGHVLHTIPSPPLFGDKYATDHQRESRYELIAALMVKSDVPIALLDHATRWLQWRFTPRSDFFSQRVVIRLNEQFIASWARRLLCFYGEITDIRVHGRELRDIFANGVAGRTTQQVSLQEYGGDPFP